MADKDPTKLYRGKDGRYYKYHAVNGQWVKRKASNQEILAAEVGPLTIEPGQALGLLKRWQVVNFANDADSLREYLESGSNAAVRPTGGGRPHDLAVSIDGGKTYRLIDPAPKRMPSWRRPSTLGPELFGMAVNDPAEFGRDILDIGMDAFNGAVTAAATVGGALLAPITGAAAGAGTEYARQTMGQMMGINRDTKWDQVAFSGAAGAAAPLVGTVARGIQTGRDLGLETAAMLTGAKADTYITRRQLLGKRVRIGAKAGEEVSDIGREAAGIRQVIAQATDQTFPETELARALERQATETVDLPSLIDPMARLTKKVTGEEVKRSERLITSTTQKTFEQARNVARSAEGTGHKMAEGVKKTWKPTADGGRMKLKARAFGKQVDETTEESATQASNMSGTAESSATTRRVTEEMVPVEELQSAEAAAMAFKDQRLPDKLKDSIDTIYKMLKTHYGVNDPTKTPAWVASEIKRMVWDKGMPGRMFQDKDLTDEYIAQLRDLGGRLRDNVEYAVDKMWEAPGAADALGPKRYSQIMSALKFKQEQVEFWQQAAGIWEYEMKKMPDGSMVPTTNRKFLDEIRGVKRMASTITNLWDESYHGINRAIDNLEALGLDTRALRGRVESAALAQRIGGEGMHGAMQTAPHFTGAGSVPFYGTMAGGIGLGSGLGFLGSGTAQGTAMGGMAAAGLATALTSPRFIVGAGKALMPAYDAMRGSMTSTIAASQNPGVRAGLAFSIQQAIDQQRRAGRKPTVRLEEP